MSNHGKWRVHANLDDVTGSMKFPPVRFRGSDGYLYEPLWLNPQDAQCRDIANGDIVKVYNERGAVLGGAYVTERIMPGWSLWTTGPGLISLCRGYWTRGGAINSITPRKTTSKNATGMVCSGFLVEAERVSLDGLRKQYPEAFNRPYDKASGQTFERVLEKGERVSYCG